MDKRKNNKMFQDIRYGFLENIAFIMIAIFTINPFVKVLTGRYSNYFILVEGYNPCVLLFGALVLFVYFMKLRSEKKLPNRKEWLKQHIPVTLFFVFGMLMIVTTLLNGAPKISVIGDEYRHEGLLGFLSYLVYFLLAAFLLSERRKKIITSLFAGSATIIGLVVFADFVVFDEKYNYAMGNNMIFHNCNHLGYYMLVATMCHGILFVTAKKIWWKMIHIVSFMLMTAVLIMNDTWGCQLALIIGAIFVIIVYSVGTGKFRPITTVLLFAITLTVVLSYTTDDRLKEKIDNNILQQLFAMQDIFDLDGEVDEDLGSGRMRLWLCTLQYIGERPVLGHGAEVTGERLAADAGVDRCHCEFLNYAVSFGVPAALVYMAAVFMVYLRGLQKKQHLTAMNYVGLCAAFAYLASSAFGNTMYYTAPYLFIALGMGYVTDYATNTKNEGFC